MSTVSITKEEAKKILSPLSDEKAFYFYTDLGAPTGTRSNTLDEFIQAIQTISSKSLEFHIARGDFEKWISTLGDETLPKQLARMRDSKLSGEGLRKRLLELLNERKRFLARIAA